MMDRIIEIHSKYDPEVVKLVMKAQDKSLESIAADVALIKDWMKTQPHLPEIMDEEHILKILFVNKHSVEVTKEKIDMYYTIRSMMPDIFDVSNPKLPHMQKLMDFIDVAVLPKLTKELFTVVIYKVKPNAKLDQDLEARHFLAHSLNLFELFYLDSWSLDFIFVIDLEGVTLDMLKLYSFTLIGQSITIFEKVFSLHGKCIYFLNSPSFLSTVLNFIKTLLKPKMFQRIKALGKVDLGDLIEKQILPKDYGGDEASLAELNERLRAKLSKYQDRFDKLDKMRVDESLRPAELDNDEFLGYHGNFKKISID